jgi:hypothetical protein
MFDDVCIDATPALNVAEGNCVLPLKNDTLPAGTGYFEPVAPVTVAVNVVFWFATVGFGDVDTVIVGVPKPTVAVTLMGEKQV